MRSGNRTPGSRPIEAPPYLDGRLFRGTLDGAVVAYDFQTGKRLWTTTIADWTKSEALDAAPSPGTGWFSWVTRLAT